MASKKIQGITIEINGDTKKLNDALKDVDKQVYGLNSDLKSLNQALKLDPKNTELLSQKYDVLKRNIESTKERLETLKTAQKQMGEYSKLTDEQKSSYNALSAEIVKVEKSLSSMNKQLKDTSNVKLDGLKDGLEKIGEVTLNVSKKIIQISAAVSSALAGVVAAGVKSYSEYEQQVGGIEAIFAGQQDKINKVLKTGSNAWKDLTLSQTDYYKTFTSTYPLVKNSIDDENKAIDLTNRMLTLESDLANTFGYDISTAANAINWALKGSFNYVDNLNLGIKGTKEGFAEAAIEAGVMGKDINKSINDLTSEEILIVLETYAKKYGVMGRTANEAASTIQGSLKSMKAAFDNFINGSGGVSDLSGAVTNFLSNIVGAIQKLAPQILDGIVLLLETLMPQIAQLLLELLPQLLEAVTNMINSLLDMVTTNTEGISNAITTIINTIVNFVTQNLPTIIKIGMTLLASFVTGIANSIPELIPVLIDCIQTIIITITQNLPLIISTGLDLLVALIEGIVNAIPQLAAMLPKIIEKIVETLTRPDMIVKIIGAALTLIIALSRGLIIAIPQLIGAIPQIISSIVIGFANSIANTNWGELGSNIVKGVLNGFVNIGKFISDAVNNVKNAVVEKFKSVFGIHSPSRLMRDEVGTFIGEGVTNGIVEGLDETQKEVNGAMRQLASGIETSVNPIINPTANTNPLYINIDKFYNKREQDVQSLAQELEYYRKNSSLATGGQ